MEDPDIISIILKLELNSKFQSIEYTSEYYKLLFAVTTEVLEEARRFDSSLNSDRDYENTELKIKSTRVLNILQLCIEKVQILFCLPIILAEDDEILNEHCSHEQKLNLVTLLQDNSVDTVSVTNIILLFSKKRCTISLFSV